MVLAEWDDGYVLDTDMRREDPIYYYVMKSEWKDAVGLQVDPLYNEAQAKEVTISIFKPHLDRPGIATPEARQHIYLRVLAVFIKRYSGWKSIKICDDFLPAMLPELNAFFKQGGFRAQPVKSNATEQVWRRKGWFSRLFG